jgi:hypothetical protein
MQTPSFDRNDLGDQGAREVTPSVTDRVGGSPDNQAPAPPSAPAGVRGFGSTALMVAINAQHRMAPPARVATTLISAGAIHRTLLAVSRANGY